MNHPGSLDAVLTRPTALPAGTRTFHCSPDSGERPDRRQTEAPRPQRAAICLSCASAGGAHLPSDTFAIFGVRVPCGLCAITPKSVELAPVIVPFHARDALELLDTATNEGPRGRSAGLRPGVSGARLGRGAGPEVGAPLAVSRCARAGARGEILLA